MPHSVVVIGAGNIAAGYDSPGDEQVLTHLHAITADPRFRCAGLYDPDQHKAAMQARRWSVPHAANVEALFAAPVDLAVIAGPDQTHEAWLGDLLERNVRIVLCEKPLTKSYASARAMVERYAARGKPLAVNYQRRFEPTALDLSERLRRGELGRPVAGAVWYSKGILHNGSHAVDFLSWLFGEVRRAIAHRRVVDFSADDPTVGGSLVFDDVTIDLIAGDERLFSLFEIDLLFERARYRYTLSGARLERYETQPDPLFPGYVEMTKVDEQPTGLGRALAGRYAALADALEGKGALASPASTALTTQQVCEALQTMPLDTVWQPGSR